MRQPDLYAAPSHVSLFAQLDAHTESNFFTGFSGDLSDGGLFVVTYEPLELGQAVQVELSLPGGRFVSVRGSVAWQRVPHHGRMDLSPGVGIVLHDLDEEATTLIATFMHLREPSFVDPDVLSQDARLRGNAVSVLPPALDVGPANDVGEVEAQPAEESGPQAAAPEQTAGPTRGAGATAPSSTDGPLDEAEACASGEPAIEAAPEPAAAQAAPPEARPEQGAGRGKKRGKKRRRRNKRR